MLKIFALGSCRIHRPLRALDKVNRIAFLNRKDPKWFFHTSRAAVQACEMCLGGDLPPAAQQPVIFETQPMGRVIDMDGRDLIARADVVVLEVSSLKSFDLDGWELNQFKLVKADPVFRDSLGPIEVTDHSAEDVKSHIRRVQELVQRPILLVDHIHIERDGAPIPKRLLLSRILAEASSELGLGMFSTRSILQDRNPAACLQNGFHYQPSFEPAVGEAILEAATAHLATLDTRDPV